MGKGDICLGNRITIPLKSAVNRSDPVEREGYWERLPWRQDETCEYWSGTLCAEEPLHHQTNDEGEVL